MRGVRDIVTVTVSLGLVQSSACTGPGRQECRRGGDRKYQEPAHVWPHGPWEVGLNSVEGRWEAV